MVITDSEAIEEFPSPVERQVASALLLLSSAAFLTTPPPPPPLTLSPPLYKMKKKNLLRFKISKSKSKSKSQSQWSCSSSSSSTVTTTTSSENGDQQRVKVIAVVSEFHEMMKLKVVRKRRSKNFFISDLQKISSGKEAVKVELSASSVSASSCVSSGGSSSVISSAGSSRNVNVMSNGRLGLGGTGNYLFLTPAAKDLKRKPVFGSAHLWRRADAILKVLSSHGRASEVKIRGLLGDSPSTSKALRILLNLEQVKRSGAGGRTDPYIYMVDAKCCYKLDRVLSGSSLEKDSVSCLGL